MGTAVWSGIQIPASIWPAVLARFSRPSEIEIRACSSPSDEKADSEAILADAVP